MLKSNKIDKQRRNIIKKIFLLLYLSNIKVVKLHPEENSYILKGPLAGSIYYTKYKPGKWKNLINSHIPHIIKKGNLLQVVTPHEMRGYEHYITKHIVLDKKLNIISEKAFDPSKDTPTSSHNIAGYADKVFVLSICNKHDTWLNLLNL